MFFILKHIKLIYDKKKKYIYKQLYLFKKFSF